MSFLRLFAYIQILTDRRAHWGGSALGGLKSAHNKGCGFMDNRRRTMEKAMDRQADHSLFHSPALKPVTHKLHSHDYYLFQIKNNNDYCRRECNRRGFQSNRNRSVAFILKT